MGPRYGELVGCELLELAADHAEWSQRTFGADGVRGPVGPLRHLAKEALEAAENPTDHEEYADCLLLVLDASRRAGLTPTGLVRAGLDKLAKNKRREWPKPTPDQPVEHVRGGAAGQATGDAEREAVTLRAEVRVLRDDHTWAAEALRRAGVVLVPETAPIAEACQAAAGLIDRLWREKASIEVQAEANAKLLADGQPVAFGLEARVKELEAALKGLLDNKPGLVMPLSAAEAAAWEAARVAYEGGSPF